MFDKHNHRNGRIASITREQRRAFLRCGLSALALAAVPKVRAASAPAAPRSVAIEMFAASGKSSGVVQVAMVVKSDAEWRAQLSALAYQVTREQGTERAYTGAYASNHDDGIYRCVCCDTPLYDSKAKYESGTGWPSFWKPISATNIVKSSDAAFGWQRDAIACKRCDAHLGHVFDDGPPPTGLRYCMNSVALRFVARAR
jgi:peptide-methionine (R)-S-oxide reductase